MHLNKCYNCPHKQGCKKKIRILAALRVAAKEIDGRIWSINFDCWERLEKLETGRVVRLEMFKSDWEYFEGVVMRPHKNRVLVWLLRYHEEGDVEIDDWRPVNSDQHNPVALHPNRITPTDKTVNTCNVCDQPEGTTTRDGRRCFCVGVAFSDPPPTQEAIVPVDEMPF